MFGKVGWEKGSRGGAGNLNQKIDRGSREVFLGSEKGGGFG